MKKENNKNGKYLYKFYAFIFMYIAVSAFILYFAIRLTVKRSDNDIRTDSDIIFDKKHPVIIIDAGHGGVDGGAESAGGIQEKNLNLQISLKLQKLLKLSDFNVIMTRHSDISLNSDGVKRRQISDLANRVSIAKKYPDAIFISIHMNKFLQEKYSGMQVFYSPNNLESVNLADFIKQNNKKYLQPENTREIKKAKDIFIMENIKNTAVLIECGFLSNQSEALLLTDNSYQNKISEVIFASILEFSESIK